MFALIEDENGDCAVAFNKEGTIIIKKVNSSKSIIVVAGYEIPVYKPVSVIATMLTVLWDKKN